MGAQKVSRFVHAIFPCFQYRDLAWYWGGPISGVGDAGRGLSFVQSLGLEPGLQEWVYLVWFMEHAKQSPHEIAIYDPYLPRSIFWKAHNTALREGVDRAAATRHREGYWEQVLINYVLYNVLYPGDRCAEGSGCSRINQLYLNVGAWGFYPLNYPATESDIRRIERFFPLIYLWWGIPEPSSDMDGAELYRLDEPGTLCTQCH